MWTLSSPDLPTIPAGDGWGLLADVAGGAQPGGLLAEIGYLADTVGVAPAAPVQGTGTVISTTVAVVAVVVAGGKVFSAAQDVGDPQPGEFVHDPFEETVTLTPGDGYPVEADTVVTVIGGDRLIVDESLSSVPPIARQLGPTLQSLTWSLSLGGHPSGTLVISATDATLPAVKAAFTCGAEFSLFGIGFRCGLKTIETASRLSAPLGDHTVSIPLEGKWLNYVEEPFTWRGVGSLTGAGQTDGVLADESVQGLYDLAEIAEAVGARYVGPRITVQVPDDAAPGESTTFAAEFTEDWHLINASVPDYSRADCITLRPIATGREWDYRAIPLANDTITQELGEVCNASTLVVPEAALIPLPTNQLPSEVPALPTPTLAEEAGTGVVIEWENVRITGQFSEPPDGNDDSAPTHATSPGRDGWVQQRRRRTKKTEGDRDAHLPPIGAVAAKDVSLNFDQSGPTKTRIVTTYEDGFVLLVETWRYGYAMTGLEIANSTNPTAHWKLIEYTSKRRLIDKQTGYAYGWDTTGWRFGRFKTETADNPETTSLDPAGAEYDLYVFKQIPIIARERQLLKQHRTFYDNFDDRDQQGEIIKVTLPDGSESIRYLRNPNYTEAFFVAAESAESVAFLSRPNPEGNDKPPLITGQESYNRMIREISPGRKRIFRGAGQEQPGDRTADRYTEYVVQFSSQDANYGNSLEDAQMKDFEGRPQVAERIPPEYVRQEPPESNTDGDTAQDETVQQMHLLNTGTPTEHLGQQLNYPAAATLEQALTAARTQATLENLEDGDREQVTVPWNPDIRPGDRIVYLERGTIRRRFVMDTAFDPSFNSDGTAQGTVTLSLSRWVDAGATLTHTIVNLPSNASGDSQAGLTIFSPVRSGYQIGEVLPANIQSRVLGNY